MGSPGKRAVKWVCLPGQQLQTCHMLLQQSIDGTDKQKNRQTDTTHRYKDPALHCSPHTERVVATIIHNSTITTATIVK